MLASLMQYHGWSDALRFLWQHVANPDAHTLIVYYILSVMIDQLPMPTSQSNGFYRWFFGVIQVLAANWNRGKIGVNGGKTSQV